LGGLLNPKTMSKKNKFRTLENIIRQSNLTHTEKDADGCTWYFLKRGGTYYRFRRLLDEYEVEASLSPVDHWDSPIDANARFPQSWMQFYETKNIWDEVHDEFWKRGFLVAKRTGQWVGGIPTYFVDDHIE